MRKVFLFWSVILFILVSGAGTIIYSKILLKKEEERADSLGRELVLPEVPEIPRTSAPPYGAEIKEKLIRIEPSEPAPSLDMESLKTAKPSEAPELPKDEITLPLSTPKTPEIPASSEPIIDLDIGSLEIPEPSIDE